MKYPPVIINGPIEKQQGIRESNVTIEVAETLATPGGLILKRKLSTF